MTVLRIVLGALAGVSIAFSVFVLLVPYCYYETIIPWLLGATVLGGALGWRVRW